MLRLLRHVPGRKTCRAIFSLGLLGLLAACASKPQLTSRQEASQYLASASRDYSPPGPASDPWGPYIVQASARFDIPERWIREVMRQESGGRLYRNGQLVTSGAGAMGLMQVMPGTYDELRSRYNLDDDPFHPLNNILAGTAYIREMYDIYGSPGFLAAYNAGPGRLDDYLTRGRILPTETRRYVAKIGPRIADAAPQRRSPAEGTMFAQLPTAIPAGPRYDTRERSSGTAYAAYTPPPVYTPPAYTPPAYTPPAYTPSEPRFMPLPAVAAVEPAPRPAPARNAGVAVALNDTAPRYSQVAPPPRQVQVAALPEPPRYVAMSPPPSTLQASYTPSVPRRPAGFNLVSPAAAEPIGIRRGGPTTGRWAIQVGAVSNDRLAVAEANAAQGKARDVLGGARVQVSTVKQGKNTLYRARLGGLSRDAALQACERLARSRTNCLIVSPDAQS